MPRSLDEIFAVPRPLIAMVHVRALPGTPADAGDLQAVIDRAVAEAELYRRAGVDGLIVENMHDAPYLPAAVGPEITAAMSVVGREVKRAAELPCGIQILAGANREALAVALAAGLDFIRAEGFVFAHVADEGTLQSCAGELLRYRRQIGAERIAVWTDIKKKHSAHAITADVDIVETARAAELFRSDGLVITGTATGRPVQIAELEALRRAVALPLIVGSGVNLDNLAECLSRADALIVGSHFKRDGTWSNPVDAGRVEALVRRARELR